MVTLIQHHWIWLFLLPLMSWECIRTAWTQLQFLFTVHASWSRIGWDLPSTELGRSTWDDIVVLIVSDIRESWTLKEMPYHFAQITLEYYQAQHARRGFFVNSNVSVTRFVNRLFAFPGQGRYSHLGWVLVSLWLQLVYNHWQGSRAATQYWPAWWPSRFTLNLLFLIIHGWSMLWRRCRPLWLKWSALLMPSME